MASRWLKIRPRAGRWGEANARWAGRSSGGAAPATVPELQDSSEAYGKFTASNANNDKGQVDLADKMRLNRNGLVGAVTWEGEFVSATTGSSAHFEVTAALTQADIAATGVGRTPYIPTAQWGALSGTYVFRYRAKVGSSGWSEWKTMTYIIDVNGNTIGNGYGGDNFPGGLFYAWSTGTQAWDGGIRTFYYPPGLNRSHHQFPNDLSFTGKVTVKNGDLSRRPRIDTIIVNGGNNYRFDGIVGGVRGVNANGHIQLGSCTNTEVINCIFRRTEAEYVAADASQQFAGVLISGSSDTILVDGNEFEHLFRGIYLAEGVNVTVTNNRGCHIHGQPLYVGAQGLAVDGVIVEDNTWWNNFRTQLPTVDVGNHQDFDQVGDALGSITAKNVRRRRNVYVMGESNSGLRGMIVCGGSGGPGSGGDSGYCKPGTVDVQLNILYMWGPGGIEAFGYENASKICRNAIFLMRSGSDATAPTGAKKDEYDPLFVGISVDPNNSANIGAAATLLLQENHTYGTIVVNGVASGVTTTDNGAYARNLTGAGYINGNDPEAYMMSFTDWGSLTPADYLTVRARAKESLRRADSKGVVDSAGVYNAVL